MRHNVHLPALYKGMTERDAVTIIHWYAQEQDVVQAEGLLLRVDSGPSLTDIPQPFPRSLPDHTHLQTSGRDSLPGRSPRYRGNVGEQSEGRSLIPVSSTHWRSGTCKCHSSSAFLAHMSHSITGLSATLAGKRARVLS